MILDSESLNPNPQTPQFSELHPVSQVLFTNLDLKMWESWVELEGFLWGLFRVYGLGFFLGLI